MGRLPKILLLLFALIALRLAARAARHQAEVAAMAWALICTIAAGSLASTPKTRSVEMRLNSLLPVVFPNTGGTVNGSINVTGNHAVGGSLNGPNGTGTLTIGTPAHVNGNGMTVDGALNTHNNFTADGNVSAATMSVTGNHTVGGTLSVTGGSTSEFDSGIHAGGEMLADGGVSAPVVTSTGTSTNEFSGGMHIGGAALVDGNTTLRQLNGASLPMGTVGALSGTVTTTQCAAAINGLISRMQSAGLIS
jgi:hypothetical protein